MRHRILAIGLAAGCCAGVAHAEGGSWTLAQGVGTGGVETQMSYALSPALELRGTFAVAGLERSTRSGGVDYHGELDTRTGGAFLDWRPFRNWFSLTGGAYFGDRGIDLDATPATSTSIGGVVYTPAEIGRLAGRIDLGSVAPYLGMAGDWRFGAQSAWGVKLAAGVAFGKADVSLRAVGGLLASDPTFQQSVATERARLEDDVSMLKTYPVVSASITYRR